MNDQYFLLKLILFALIEIREKAHYSGDRLSYDLSDILHLIPSGMTLINNGTLTYEDLLKKLENRAKENGCYDWIDTIYSKIGYPEQDQLTSKTNSNKT